MRRLVAILNAGGHLCLGHSETIEAQAFGLSALGNTTYKKVDRPEELADRKLSKSFKITRRSGLGLDSRRPDLILIGASTGGTEVLVKLLEKLPQPCPPLFVVQHIALAFAESFAARLAQISGLQLADPIPGAQVMPGRIYMALGDYHIGVKYRGGLKFMDVHYGAIMHGVRPAVDYLFQSAVEVAKNSQVMAILLTGMGKDGARGITHLRDAGAITMVQDEASSTVFGMPREAIALGGAQFIGNPAAIRQRLLAAIKGVGMAAKTAGG